ncbi:hypothetical protein L6Q96_15000 [Candidatus Binatia bacterium]|nr:hypothetical protein [Candidatus Binatia bacterium]
MVRFRVEFRNPRLWGILVLLAFVAACGDNDGVSPPGASTATVDGYVDPAYMRARSIDYLRFATASFAAGNPLNVIAHLERERLDPPYTAPRDAIPVDAWDRQFAKMAALEDTRDFDATYLLNLLLGYREHPALPRALVDKVEAALVAFKFWYTEPTPAGMLDNSYYWTENHEILYHAIEYLMGQTYPDRVFSSDGKSGREHLAHARGKLLRWFDIRARFGFSEWHSNVYYQKDLTPLLTLAEYAQDPAIATRAAMVLDVLLFDLALHTQRAAFGVTHGRSYKKDKMTSLTEDTWGATKMLFDTTEYPYQSISHADAVLLARARRYRVPEAILRVARSPQSFVDRERMSIDIQEDGPYDRTPRAPYEFSFTDPEDLSVWWSIGAITTWPVVPLTVQTMEQYNLWETTNFAPFIGFRDLAGDIEFAQGLALRYGAFLSFALLKEVNTYTYRTPDYILSSAIDYRKGRFGAQYHSWQATFDANAIAFTNHPFRPLARSTDWLDDSEDGGYWNGEASMPRSAQYENVAVHIYAPQYRPRNPEPFTYFRYEPYTHAYFPQDHFEEVVQEGPWTFGRFRDGYLALYSHRPATFMVYDPAVYATNGMVKPFDMRADGGADTVWIVECGRKVQWGGFEAFRSAIVASRVVVTSRGPVQAGVSPGYDVEYDSPSQGRIAFGWEAPFVVRGVEQPLSGYPRFDNPWSQTPFNTRTMRIEAGEVGVVLDFERTVREVYGR